MDVIVTFKYKQYFYPNVRCTKVRDRVLSIDYAVYVKDVLDERDFPVAYKVRDYQTVLPKVRDNEEAWELCHHGDGGRGMWFTETIRRYKNKLYKPVRHGYGSVIARSFVNPKEHVANEVDWFQNRSAFCFVGQPKDDPQFDLEKSIVVGDDYTKRLAEVKKLVKQFVVFKGVLWEQTEEPLYTYTTFGLGCNHGGTGFFISYGRRCNSSSKIYWKAEQRDQAIKAAIKAATDRGDTESIQFLKKPKELITKF
jgi:hypothetical protein